MHRVFILLIINNIIMSFCSYYVKASWEIVMEAESVSEIFLNQTLEVYLVNTMAKKFDTPLNDSSMSISLLEATKLPNTQKKQIVQEVGDNCLFIDAWQLKKKRWPHRQYYEDLGRIAYNIAATVSYPADEVLQEICQNFGAVSQVLRQAKNLTKKISYSGGPSDTFLN